MNKKNIIILLALAAFLITGAALIKNSQKVQTLETTNQQSLSTQGKSSQKSAPASNSPDTDADGVPDVAEKTLGTDPNNADTDGDGVGDLQDKDPVFTENPINNKSTQEGFQITEALVENNVDSITNKIANDHLELTIKNISGKDLSDFEFYYTVTDPAANKKEAYYKKLSGFVLKSGETKSIHFDNVAGEGHFSENPNSIYRITNAAKIFDLTLSAAGYKVQTIKINKDPGGTEKAD